MVTAHAVASNCPQGYVLRMLQYHKPFRKKLISNSNQQKGNSKLYFY